MAKQKQQTPVAPNFHDIDAESVARAQAAVQGGNWPTLKVPVGSKSSTDAKTNITYTRWSEHATIMSAYRTTAKSGLLDVVVIVKIRQSEKNSGMKAAGHFYMNLGDDISEGHEQMNDRSNGALITALVAVGSMPTGGTLKGSLLDRMFPLKDKPGSASPLNGKALIINLVQQFGPKKDTNKKVMLDAEGEPILEKRDNIESFLPEAEEDEVEAEADEAGEADDDDGDPSEPEETEEEVVAPAPARVIPAKRRK
jgi:hypothetical protein